MPSLNTLCPACGGPVHTVAGRCKHCKTDLVTFRARALRAARAAAGVVSPIAPAAPEPAERPPVRSPASAAAAYQTIALGNTGHRPSGWSRRWPFVVAAIALVVISVSVGILVERWRAPAAHAEVSRAPQLAVSPHQVPDDMQSGPMPQPDIAPDPDIPAPVDPPPVPPDDPPPSNAPSVDLFAAALTETLCDKFKECGLDSQTTTMICEMLDKAVHDELAAKGTQCAYDADAGERCLGAIRALQCDAGAANGDMIDWLMAASSLADCTSAYQCNGP